MGNSTRQKVTLRLISEPFLISKDEDIILPAEFVLVSTVDNERYAIKEYHYLPERVMKRK